MVVTATTISASEENRAMRTEECRAGQPLRHAPALIEQRSREDNVKMPVESIAADIRSRCAVTIAPSSAARPRHWATTAVFSLVDAIILKRFPNQNNAIVLPWNIPAGYRVTIVCRQGFHGLRSIIYFRFWARSGGGNTDAKRPCWRSAWGFFH